MATILPFTGGKRCEDCTQQIPPKRVRAMPTTTVCVTCAATREADLLREISFPEPDHRDRIHI